MRIGKYIVPNSRLDVLLIALKKIDDTFMGEEGSKQDIADILGHEPKSGTLAQKIGDFKTYGLLEGRKDKLAVTGLGKRVVSARETERNEAIGEVVKHVPLWSMFYGKYGTSIPKENFAVALRRDTHAEQSVAEKNANFVRNAYLRDVKLMESVGEPGMGPESHEVVATDVADRKSTMETQSAGAKKASIDIGQGYGIARFEIRDQEDYDIAQNLLETIRLSLKLKKARTQLLLEAIASKLDIPPLTNTDRSINDHNDNEEPKENLD
jgi:hypothetical protein